MEFVRHISTFVTWSDIWSETVLLNSLLSELFEFSKIYMLEQFWLIEKLTNLLTFRILWTNIFAMAPLFQKPPNCHFPSLSPTIEGDGGQQRKKMKIWDICAGNQNLGHLCWNGAKLPFSFTLAQPLRRCWSSALSLSRPKRSNILSFIVLLCIHFWYCQELARTHSWKKMGRSVLLSLMQNDWCNDCGRSDFHPISAFRSWFAPTHQWFAERGVTETETWQIVELVTDHRWMDPTWPRTAWGWSRSSRSWWTGPPSASRAFSSPSSPYLAF